MSGFSKLLIEKATVLIHTAGFCEKHKTSESSFTRLRCMGFTKVVGLCLNFLRKTLQVEIDRFMELTDPKVEKPMTKQAFSKARHKISPDAFRELFEMTSQTAFEQDAFSRYKGYRVFAVDGTELQLPKTKELSSMFKHTNHSFSPRCRASVLCDVVSGITIHAVMASTEVGERILAMEHLQYYEAYNQSKSLIIFDRGYPSKALIEHLESRNIKYLMRLQKSFNAEIDKSNKQDFHVTISNCKVRVLKLCLPNGETETLITSLGRKSFKKDEFQELYHLRWGIETKYNTIKNKLAIENFSGKTFVTVLQDFYATMFLSNISASIKAESTEIIREQNAEKELKHEYVTNENVLIGKLKDKLIMILLNDNADERAMLLDKLIEQISRYRTAVVQGRNFPRPVTSHKRTCCKIKQPL